MLSYQHVLCAIDLAKGSETILKQANDIAKLSNAKLSIVHITTHTPMAFGNEFSTPIHSKFELELKKEIRDQLITLANKYHILSYAQYVRDGSVKSQVTDLAKTIHADLIVIGSHDRQGLLALLGSHANAILHAAFCDILMVKV